MTLIFTNSALLDVFAPDWNHSFRSTPPPATQTDPPPPESRDGIVGFEIGGGQGVRLGQEKGRAQASFVMRRAAETLERENRVKTFGDNRMGETMEMKPYKKKAWAGHCPSASPTARGVILPPRRG